MRKRRDTAGQWAIIGDTELVEMYRSTAVDAAFEELVRRYQVRLYRVLLGMVSNPGKGLHASGLCPAVRTKSSGSSQ